MPKTGFGRFDAMFLALIRPLSVEYSSSRTLTDRVLRATDHFDFDVGASKCGADVEEKILLLADWIAVDA